MLEDSDWLRACYKIYSASLIPNRCQSKTEFDICPVKQSVQDKIVVMFISNSLNSHVLVLIEI